LIATPKPYTTLFRSEPPEHGADIIGVGLAVGMGDPVVTLRSAKFRQRGRRNDAGRGQRQFLQVRDGERLERAIPELFVIAAEDEDRKSTRLKSSHSQ